MNCKKCGNILNQGDTFCNNCGEPVNTPVGMSNGNPQQMTSASVQPTPVAPQPMASAPVQPTPVAPQSVASAPVQSTPVAPQPMASAPVQPTPVAPQPMASAPVQPTPVAPQPMVSAPVQPTSVAPQPMASAPVQPTPVVPQPMTANANKANKSNNSFKIIIIVLVLLILALGGFITYKLVFDKDEPKTQDVDKNTNKEDSKDKEDDIKEEDKKEEDKKEDDNNNVNVSADNRIYQYKGIKFTIPDGLIYEDTGEFLAISDKKSFNASFVVQDINYVQAKNDINNVLEGFKNNGYTITNHAEISYKDDLYYLIGFTDAEGHFGIFYIMQSTADVAVTGYVYANTIDAYDIGLSYAYAIAKSATSTASFAPSNPDSKFVLPSAPENSIESIQYPIKK